MFEYSYFSVFISQVHKEKEEKALKNQLTFLPIYCNIYNI